MIVVTAVRGQGRGSPDRAREGWEGGECEWADAWHSNNVRGDLQKPDGNRAPVCQGGNVGCGEVWWSAVREELAMRVREGAGRGLRLDEPVIVGVSYARASVTK